MLNSYDDNQREKCLERKNPTRERKKNNKLYSFYLDREPGTMRRDSTTKLN